MTTSVLRIVLLLSTLAQPACVCSTLPERVTSLADWPAGTLRVNVQNSAEPPSFQDVEQAALISVTFEQQVEGDACPVLADDARFFIGAVNGSDFEHGQVEYFSSGGGDLTLPSPILTPGCVAPSSTTPISDAIGDSDVIDVGFADDSASFSATIRRPPVEPRFDVDVSDGALVARGDEIAFVANVPLDGPQTTLDAGVSQCQTGEPSFDCALDPTLRLEGSGIAIVTMPAAAASEGASVSVSVIEDFAVAACTADSCESVSNFRWIGTVHVVVE